MTKEFAWMLSNLWVWLVLLFWLGVAILYSTFVNHHSFISKVLNTGKIVGFVLFWLSLQYTIFYLQNVPPTKTSIVLGIFVGGIAVLGDWFGYLIYKLAWLDKSILWAAMRKIGAELIKFSETQQKDYEKTVEQRIKEFYKAVYNSYG